MRLQLGITKFQPDDPIAKEIHDEFVKNRHRYYGIKHGDPNWMEHTLIAQRIVQKHGLKVHDPIVFNPFPLWMRKPRFGEIVFGVRLPTIQQVKSESVTFTTWEGYPDFARDVVLEKLGVIDIKPKIRGFNGIIYHGGGQMIECVLCGIGWNPKFGLTCSICKRTWTPNGEDDIAGPFLTPNLKSLTGSSSSNQEGIQIFIKSLLGLSLTVKPRANDTVKDLINLLLEKTYETCQGVDLDLFTAEQTKWESGKFGLNYKGKTLEEERTLSEYGVEKGSTLYMVLKMSGEGKRGNSSREDQSKDGAIDEIERTLQKCVTEVGTLDGLELLQGTVANLNTHIDATKQNPDAVKILLAQMDKTSLLRILTALETNNGDAKLANLKNTFYKTEVGQIRTVNDKTKSILEAFWHSINYMLTSAFSNETGRIQWSVLKQEVLNQVSLRDQAIGAQAARHG